MSEAPENRKILSPKELALLSRFLKGDGIDRSGMQAIPRRDRQHSSPLSFSQQRIWFLDQLEPGLAVYHMPLSYSLEGELNIDALRQSLDEILRRHEILRTSFQLVEGEVAQVEEPAASFPLTVVPFDGNGDRERKRAEMSAAATQPFHLSRGPLIHGTLWQVSPAEYWLLILTHHIVADGVSIVVLLHELQVLYEAFSRNAPSPLAEPPIQFADFAAWQNEQLRDDAMQRLLEYWTRQLGGDLPVLELPHDGRRSASSKRSAAYHPFVVSQSIFESLKELSRTQGATLFMTLLATFQTLLHRYTRQTDILLGCPIANRTRSDTKELIGCLVNTLVLRTDFSGDPTFLQLLSQVRKTALDAYAHQDMPFEKLVEKLAPKRDLNTSPLLQALFNFTAASAQATELKLPLLRVKRLQLYPGPAKFDLSLHIDEREQLCCTFEYDQTLFSEETIARLAECYCTLLRGVVTEPDRRVSTLPLLSEAQKHGLLKGWNEAAVDPSPGKAFCQLFEKWAATTPDAIAVTFEEHGLTYGALNRRVNRLARRLRSLGVGPGVRVGILLERSIDMLVSVLAVLKSGGAYIPVDPNYPAERVAYMFRDSDVALVLSEQSLITPFSERDLLLVDPGEAVAAAESEDNPGWEPIDDAPAYVLYTSGSMGKPKGVVIPYKALHNLLTSIEQQPGLSSQDTLLAVTTLSFDIASLELLLPLMAGARLVIATHATAKDAFRLIEELDQHEVTFMQATPATWKMLVEAGWRGRSTMKVLSGGEALSPELAQELSERSQEVWNLYGPTETTIYSTLWRIVNPLAGVRIGKPVRNNQTFVLDDQYQPIPQGMVGDLYIGGAGLATCYLNLPDRTAESLIPHPFSEEPGACLYKSGDSVRYDAEGNLEYLGRTDHQLKIRGFRIEAGEIELVLLAHLDVVEVVAVARDDSAGEKTLVAYVAAKDDHQPSVAELQSLLKAKLPAYMVPSTLVMVDALPRTPNGKIDRRALPPPNLSGVVDHEARAPRTPVETALVNLWTELLDRPIGIHDNFFDAGGHSL